MNKNYFVKKLAAFSVERALTATRPGFKMKLSVFT